MFKFVKKTFCLYSEKHEFTVFKINERDTPYLFHKVKDFKEFLINNQDTVSFVNHTILKKNGVDSKLYGLFTIDIEQTNISLILETPLTQMEVDSLLNL